MKKLFSLLIFLFISTLIIAQTQVHIIDEDGSSIPNAHIKIKGLSDASQQHFISDLDGNLSFNIKSKSAIQISFVGFQSIIDTISPGDKRTFRMKTAVLDLNQVVVTGQYSPGGTDKSIYKIKVIDAKDIQLRASTNLEDILNAEANITISQDGVFGSNLNLQGIGGENVKILIDGVPMIGRLDGKLDLSQINLNDVERIEIVEGPMSVNYGSNALGGVINIITKDQVGGKWSVNLSSYAESIGKVNNSGNIGFNKGKNSFMFSAGRNYFGGYDSYDTTRMLQWKPKEQNFSRFKYKRRFGNKSLQFSTDYFKEFVLDKGNPVLDIDTLNNYYFWSARDGYYHTTRFNNQLSLNGVTKKQRYFNLIASHSYYSRQKQVFKKNLYTHEKIPSIAEQDNDTTLFHNILFKGEMSRYETDSLRLNYQLGYDLNRETGIGKKIEDGQKSIGDYAVFVGLKYSPNSFFILQPAVRAAYNTKYKAPLTPSLNLKIIPNDNVQIRLSYAKGFRAPSLKELYLDFVDLNHKIYGNPDIGAERSDNYSFNAAYTSMSGQHSYRWEIDGFYNNISDKINLVPQFIIEGSDTTQIYTYANIDSYRTQGGRVSLHYKRVSLLEFKLSAAAIGRYYNLLDGSNEEKIYYRPEIASTFKLQCPFLMTTFMIVYKYNGKSLRDFLDVDENIVTYEEAAFHHMDITANKNLFNDRLRITTGAKNLFNVTNISTLGNISGGVHTGGGGDSRPVGYGRTYFVSLNYKFYK